MHLPALVQRVPAPCCSVLSPESVDCEDSVSWQLVVTEAQSHFWLQKLGGSFHHALLEILDGVQHSEVSVGSYAAVLVVGETADHMETSILEVCQKGQQGEASLVACFENGYITRSLSLHRFAMGRMGFKTIFH